MEGVSWPAALPLAVVAESIPYLKAIASLKIGKGLMLDQFDDKSRIHWEPH